MKAALDISIYPLTENYKAEVLAFIEDLKTEPSLTVITNNLSTQIGGDYDLVFDTVKKALKKFHATKKAVAIIKIAEGIDIQ